jgi:threonylcarbamoyladenosine tRNA methylthiotransferase MtaB
MNNRVSFHTLGCKLNQYETDIIRDGFIRKGYSVVKFGEQSDVTIINTCIVTHNAEFKSRQAIRRAIKFSPNSSIIVVGCYSQLSAEEISKIKDVSMILGSDEKFNVLNYLESQTKFNQTFVKISSLNSEFTFEKDSNYSTERTRAFLKIQDGCNYYCSYCIVPYVRGESRCRNASQIINDAIKLANSGFNEIVLTAVNLAEYYDNDCGNLSSLLKKLINIDGIPRIRLSSIEVNKIDDEFMDIMAGSEKICKHLHIPLQSGDDKILSLMKRKYTRNYFREKVNKIVKMMPEIGIGTDVIVGFPGEKLENFENTVEFIKEMPFSYMHIFSYSQRKGTEAEGLPDRVGPNEIKERSKLLIEIAKEKKRDFLKKNLGRLENVVFESPDNENMFSGFSSNYIRVKSKGENLRNKLKKVKIVKAEDGFVIGEILD